MKIEEWLEEVSKEAKRNDWEDMTENGAKTIRTLLSIVGIYREALGFVETVSIPEGYKSDPFVMDECRKIARTALQQAEKEVGK